MSEQVVNYQLDGELGLLRIANPPVNALSQAVRAGIMASLQTARADAGKLLLILCRGRTFIAGADIAEFGSPPRAPGLPELIAALECFDRPVLAALHGTALGGGLELAMAAHYRCAVPTARLGLPEVKLGLLPGAGGTQRLPRLVGVEAALDMMIGGSPISAARALELGLLDALLEGELEPAAIAYAQGLIATGAEPRPTGELPVEPPPTADFFAAYRARIARRSRGLIAPGYCLELVEFATQGSLAEGQVLERKRFEICRNSPQSAALRHVFFAERAAAKLPAPAAAETAAKSSAKSSAKASAKVSAKASTKAATGPGRELTSVAVIGAGTMGGGIAMCCANAGLQVSLVDSGSEQLQRGLDVIGENYQRSVQRGRYTQSQVDAWLAAISGTTAIDAAASADIVIEAVFENMAVKQELFRRLDTVCKPGCVLATNTSYLDVNAIAAVTGRPQDCIGAHFFSPANVMKLLEVIPGRETLPEVTRTVMQLARRIGKIAVVVGACQGFVGNRMLRAYMRQAQLLLLEGAAPEQVDAALEDWGMAMGPLAVSDLAGLDIAYRSRRDRGLAPHAMAEFALADRLVEMQRLGQKAGAGYYRYDPATRRRQADPEVVALSEQLAAQWQVKRRSIDATEIVERLLLSLVNEAAAILAEGMAARPGDIDIVYLYGYGFPAWRGGPMYWADSIGLPQVLEKLAALAQLTGDSCWQPAPLLQELVVAGSNLTDHFRGAGQ